MENKIFKIYRSSAGSGKTYQLALEYLKLSLRHPGYYRKILAVTFTNKAAHEMKSRILETLDRLSKGQASSDIVDKLTQELNINPIILQEKSRHTLESILHGYSYLSVGTIDSFFQKVVLAFARDIGIQGGFSIEFDQDSVTEELIDHIYLELEKDDVLLNWLRNFTGSRIEDNKTWDIRYEMRDLAREIYRDYFHEYLDSFKDSITDKKKLLEVLGKLVKERSIFRNTLENYGKKALKILHESQLSVDDLIYKKAGPGGFLANLAEGNEPEIKPRINEAYESQDAWYSKSSDKKDRIIEALNNGLYDLFQRCIDYYKLNLRTQQSYRLVLKLFYNLGIYSNLIQQLKEYRDRNDCILISDLSHLLKVIIGENDAPFIYEKTGSFFQHFLIDEFQDTSLFQWNNFKPLINNSLASGQFNMLVGDVKQSIYRWRGGDWQILQQQVEQDIGKDFIQTVPLNRNWRSYDQIISFNNAVFKNLPEILTKYFRDQGKDIPEMENFFSFSSRFVEVYGDSDQYLPDDKNIKKGGLVRIQFLDKVDKEDPDTSGEEKMFRELENTIHRILSGGFELKDIAVLVRSKDQGKKIADFLLTLNSDPSSQLFDSLDVISSESLFLNTSPAVNIVINFMRLVLNEDDNLAQLNFYYWLSKLLDKTGKLSYEDIFSMTQANDRGSELIKLLSGKDLEISFQSLRTLPVEDLLEVIVHDLALEHIGEQQSYLLGLQNAILDFRESDKGDLYSFLEWWEEEGKKRSIKPSEEQNAIQIMTIHQSKGLQFEMVLVPYCTWSLDHKANSTVIWCGSDIPPLNELPVYPLKYEKALSESDFAGQYYDEMSMAFMDNLNLLYVTFTRAIRGLFVFADKPGNAGSMKNVGELLYHMIDQAENKPSDTADVPSIKLKNFWNAEKGLLAIGEFPEVQKKITDLSFQISPFKTGKWYTKISIRKQPDIFSEVGEVKTPEERVNLGVILHEILSGIIIKSDAEKVLEHSLRSGRINEGNRDQLMSMLSGLWKNDKVIDWFSGRWKIRTEVPVLPETGEISRMDRVMTMEDQAIVVDYKTGMERKKDYDQVHEYKQILKKMGYRSVTGYLLYLGQARLIEV